MHYILKLPGTIAQVVNYPTTRGFENVNEASSEVVKINDAVYKNPWGYVPVFAPVDKHQTSI